MTRFDRHLIGRLLAGVVVLTGLLIVFFIVLHYVEYVDDFFDRGATLSQVFLHYYPSYIPEIVKLTSPLAVFLAAIHLTAGLSQSLQLQALQTSGVSLYRILVPYALVGVVITGFMFWFNGWIVPGSNRAVLDFEARYLKDAPRQLDVTNIHRQNRPGSIVTVGFYDQRMQTAHHVSLQEFGDDERLLRRIDAERMRWIDTLAVWQLNEVIDYRFAPEGSVERLSYARQDTALHVLPRDFARTERDVEMMTLSEAARYVEDLQRAGVSNLGRTQVGYYVKYAYPLANLILILLALPLAAVRRRGGQAVQLGLGLAVAFLYLAAQKLTEPYGYAGTLSPFVTAWLPHALFLGVALVILIRARK